MIILLAICAFMAGAFVSGQSIVYTMAVSAVVVFVSGCVQLFYRDNQRDQKIEQLNSALPETVILEKEDDPNFVEVVSFQKSEEDVLAKFDSRVVSLGDVQSFAKGYLTSNGYPLNLVYISSPKKENAIVYSYGRNADDRRRVLKITNINIFKAEEEPSLADAYA